MSTLNITHAIAEIIKDAAIKLEEFSHIKSEQILLSLSTTRSGGIHGTYARIHPLRFEEGEMSKCLKKGKSTYSYTMPSVSENSLEILYIIYFLVPRFMNLSPKEKLITIFHELYHVSPSFNGDIRRFEGRNYAHGSSRKKFNKSIEKIADKYIAMDGSTEVLEPISLPLAALKVRHRAVVGRKFPTPKIKVTRL